MRELSTIDEIVRGLARRYRLDAEERADVASWVNLRLVEDDYAILKKFEGRSSLRTYLAVVIANLFRDYRISKWGRWRPSAAARRAGDLGVDLERLIQRDGHSLDAAIRVLRSAGAVESSDRELAELAALFPKRGRPRIDAVGDQIDRAVAGTRADAVVEASEQRAKRDRLMGALEQALNRLPSEDRVILKLRFWEAFSVADIARALSLEQRPLYRRVNRLLDDLRGALSEAGFAAEDVQALFPSGTGEDMIERRNAATRPSHPRGRRG